MGNPLAPQVAIIYMDHVEKRIISRLNHPIQWRRYIDDIFIVWNNDTTPNDILNIANNVNEAIQFTLEKPNSNNELPYLDCLVKLVDNTFETKLYFKPIHSGIISNYSSFSPISTKKATILGELRRADKRSTTESNRELSRQLVLDRFRNNGYPNKLLENTLRDYLTSATRNDLPTNKLHYIKCPFVNEPLKRKFQAILRRTGLHNKIKLWFDAGKPLKRIFKPPKERLNCQQQCETCQFASTPNLCMNKHLIYEVTCEICHSIYRGETKRMVGQRIREHLHGTNLSAVKLHFTEQHPNTKINISWRILHSNLTNDFRRRAIESQYIKQIPHGRQMNLTLQ